jgi:cysteine-rich repeat protein
VTATNALADLLCSVSSAGNIKADPSTTTCPTAAPGALAKSAICTYGFTFSSATAGAKTGDEVICNAGSVTKITSITAVVTPTQPVDAGAGAIVTCGDYILEVGEQCDDGNTNSGDGCSSSCQIEVCFVCPNPGAPCIDYCRCGNGVLDPFEACDDGNTVGGDGCSADCQKIEPGYTCPTPGQGCFLF